MERSWDNPEAWKREASRQMDAGRRPTVAVLCRACMGALRSRLMGFPNLGDIRYCDCNEEYLEDVITIDDLERVHGIGRMYVEHGMQATD